MGTDLKTLMADKLHDSLTEPHDHHPSRDPAPPQELEVYGGTGDAPNATIDVDALTLQVVETLRLIYDPEIPVNIYDLGLIYEIFVDDDAVVHVSMTLTAPGCPVADMIVREVADQVGALPAVKQSHVRLTWDPPWTKDCMSEAAMLELGLL